MKAFPNHRSEGMDLRDYFAAQAMQALMLKDRFDSISYERLCKGAYITADAMIKAREIKGE